MFFLLILLANNVIIMYGCECLSSYRYAELEQIKSSFRNIKPPRVKAGLYDSEFEGKEKEGIKAGLCGVHKGIYGGNIQLNEPPKAKRSDSTASVPCSRRGH